MSLRHAHVPTERLAVLALAGTDEEQGVDADALAHVSTCQSCATALSRLMTDLEDLRHEAQHEADAQFSDARLETQRLRVLERLAHLGQAARVLPFPLRAVKTVTARPVVNRRLISMAAAAGLLIGIATGQVMHIGGWDRGHVEPLATVSEPTLPPTLPPVHAAGIVPVSASLTDYVTLTDMDSAVKLRRASNVMVFDTLTPTLVGIP